MRLRLVLRMHSHVLHHPRVRDDTPAPSAPPCRSLEPAHAAAAGLQPGRTDACAPRSQVERRIQQQINTTTKGKKGNTTGKQYLTAKSKWYGAFIKYSKWDYDATLVWLAEDGSVKPQVQRAAASPPRAAAPGCC